VALVAVMSLARAYAAWNFPLTSDEAYYWVWSLHPALGYTDHPPMVAWLITLGSLFGHSYGAVRLPFIIAEAVTALAVGMATKIISGDTRAGAFAAIVVTLIPQTKLEFAECIPDGAYVLAWSLGLWAAAATARRPSPRAIAGLGAAFAACIYSREFGWALIAGVLAWAFAARRDLLRPVLAACAIAAVAYVPFLVWNASVGWETFAFMFVHRQSVATFSPAKLLDLGTLRFLVYGVLIVVLTWFVAVRRPPYLWLVVWTALPLPLVFFVLSFAMQTESYWILGPAASLSIACGVRLAQASLPWRVVTFGVLGLTTAYATAAAIFLALPEPAQAAAFAAQPSLRAQFSSGMYVFRPLADDLRADAAAGIAIYTDRYTTSSQLLWYGVPSIIVTPTAQLTEWSRWYQPATVPQRADIVLINTPWGDFPGLEQSLHAAYVHVGVPQKHDYYYAGRIEGTFYITRIEGPRPAPAAALPGT